jgi:hypothetical protein
MGEGEKAICISIDIGFNFNVSTSINFYGGFRRSQLIVKTHLGFELQDIKIWGGRLLLCNFLDNIT